MLVKATSQLTGKTSTREIPVTKEELDTYYNSKISIQRAFPFLSANDREFIMTGITPEEWEKYIPPEEE